MTEVGEVKKNSPTGEECVNDFWNTWHSHTCQLSRIYPFWLAQVRSKLYS